MSRAAVARRDHIRSMLADPAQCPTLAEFAGRFLDGHAAMMGDTREEVTELVSRPIVWRVENQVPKSVPTTTSRSAPKSTFTPSAW